ncbi:MAG: hypothetical protein WCP09_01990 [Candidatus Taylorbacteria bacterium]
MSSGVEFDEEGSSYARPNVSRNNNVGRPNSNFDAPQYTPTGNEPAMVRWLLRHGYVKTPAAANIVLLVLVGLNVVVTYFVVTNFL